MIEILDKLYWKSALGWGEYDESGYGYNQSQLYHLIGSGEATGNYRDYTFLRYNFLRHAAEGGFGDGDASGNGEEDCTGEDLNIESC